MTQDEKDILCDKYINKLTVMFFNEGMSAGDKQTIREICDIFRSLEVTESVFEKARKDAHDPNIPYEQYVDFLSKL